MNEEYKFLSFFESDCCNCDNCGKGIKNVVEIANTNGQKFNVWTDCADTLTLASLSDTFAYRDALKNHNRKLSLFRKIRKAEKEGVFSHKDYVWLFNKADKGRWLSLCESFCRIDWEPDPIREAAVELIKKIELEARWE